jgi:hypothetical protein
MASTSLTVQVPVLLGTVITGVSAIASSETCTIQAATAQGVFNCYDLYIRITASGGSVTPTINVGTRYSNVGLGAKTLTTIASSASAIIGGKDFEDARFLNTANTIVFSFTGTGTSAIEAYAIPPGTIGY